MRVNDLTQSAIRWKPLVAAGLISGVLQITTGIVMYVSGVYFSPWSAWVSLTVLAVCIVAGTWWYDSRVAGGRSSYGIALVVGLAISVCTGLGYMAYNVITISFVYPGFLEEMVQARYRGGGNLESLRAQTTMGAVVAANFIFLVVRGAVISAVTALAFRSRGGGKGNRLSEI